MDFPFYNRLGICILSPTAVRPFGDPTCHEMRGHLHLHFSYHRAKEADIALARVLSPGQVPSRYHLLSQHLTRCGYYCGSGDINFWGSVTIL